mmetsp:Transcript_2818/g.11334  ORF Transcript_2818/g.11334 Transcript_2818/m.11334 type:complete len:348 (+) Transcript_2818:234-1277(+)
MMNTAMQAVRAVALIASPRWWSCSCSGVRLPVSHSWRQQVLRAQHPPELAGLEEAEDPPSDFALLASDCDAALRLCAMRPTRVSIPMANTTTRATPLSTVHDMKTSLRGVRASSVGEGGDADLPTARASPVSRDSSTDTSAAVTTRQSAGTTSPVSSRTRSPTTRLLVSTTCSLPARMTRLVGLARPLSAARAWLAPCSVATEMVALSTTMMMTATPSTTSPRANEAMHAATRSRMMTFKNCWAKRMRMPGGGSSRSSFLPSRSSRAAASASESPERMSVLSSASAAISVELLRWRPRTSLSEARREASITLAESAVRSCVTASSPLCAVSPVPWPSPAAKMEFPML